MKVVWIVNILMPDIAKALNIKPPTEGGWLIGLHQDLKELKDIELCICCPIDDKNKVGYQEKINGTEYYLFKHNSSIKVENQNTNLFADVFNKTKPDIIHIFGTEYTHTYSAVLAAQSTDMQEKVVISIQGMVSIYAKHFYAGLPENIVKSYTFRERIKLDNIRQMKNEYEVRGKYEIEALRSVKNIIGRTDWDKACSYQINPRANYFKCNETLRPSFYEGEWKFERCEKHSIFFTQSNMPLKGFHKMLEAMPLILKEYPDTRIYITGMLKTTAKDIKSRLAVRTYDRYLHELIIKYKLEDKIIYMGSLTEEKMKEAFLRANVFVSASSIENSPNSVGESMLLGVPTISSLVGGVSSMIEDKSEGLFYPYDAEYMLAYYVCEIFRNQGLTEQLSSKARIRARKTHDKTQNLNQLISAYKTILNGPTQ